MFVTVYVTITLMFVTNTLSTKYTAIECIYKYKYWHQYIEVLHSLQW